MNLSLLAAFATSTLLLNAPSYGMLNESISNPTVQSKRNMKELIKCLHKPQTDETFQVISAALADGKDSAEVLRACEESGTETSFANNAPDHVLTKAKMLKTIFATPAKALKCTLRDVALNVGVFIGGSIQAGYLSCEFSDFTTKIYTSLGVGLGGAIGVLVSTEKRDITGSLAYYSGGMGDSSSSINITKKKMPRSDLACEESMALGFGTSYLGWCGNIRSGVHFLDAFDDEKINGVAVGLGWVGASYRTNTHFKMMTLIKRKDIDRFQQNLLKIFD